jgi:hypothetical protein
LDGCGRRGVTCRERARVPLAFLGAARSAGAEVWTCTVSDRTDSTTARDATAAAAGLVERCFEGGADATVEMGSTGATGVVVSAGGAVGGAAASGVAVGACGLAGAVGSATGVGAVGGTGSATVTGVGAVGGTGSATAT